MAVGTNAVQPRVSFDTAPDRYRHWKLSFDGAIATLSMDVQEDAGLSPDYRLKLNSYDLGVDIELADAVQRIRFEHPEVHAVVITSLKERIFCAGANIFMLRGSSHAWKVNFCKFTNETRLAIEDASAHSGLKFVAALNGICAGGGYELALACDEILLVDDGNSAVSLPETPLLAVLPGTGGLTRVVDKRKVRRDLADVFGTVAEGVKGRRAVEWRLVDAVYPTSQFKERVAKRAAELAATSDRPSGGPGISLGPLAPVVTGDTVEYSRVSLQIDRARRVATLTVKAPDTPQPATPEEILQAGDAFWPLRAFRELDAALLHLRIDEPLIGTVVVRTDGDPAAVLAVDETLLAHADHWLVREIVHFMKRTLKRMDLTARSFFALIEPGSCFAGSLFELALAADRSYMLDDPERPERDRSLRHEWRAAQDEQRPHAPRDAISRACLSASRSCSVRRAIRSARPRSTRASCRSHPTSSTGTTKSGWPSRRARRCRPTPSPAWKRTCDLPDPRRWRRRFSPG